MRTQKMVLVFSGVFLIVGIATLGQAKRPRNIPNGTWGGLHIQLSVADGAATIEYDCANGKIDGPLRINSRGRFDLRGKHVREHGGPVRMGENRDGEPARYTGWTDGKTMKLTVTLVNTKTVVGTYTLTHGKEGRVFKCL
jgi:hypothetical protein